jgi:hypothetical protein
MEWESVFPRYHGVIPNYGGLIPQLKITQIPTVSDIGANAVSVLSDGTLVVGSIAASSTGLLKLDQTTPQTVINGAPLFNLGLKSTKIYPPADSTTAIQFMKADGTTPVLTINTTDSKVIAAGDMQAATFNSVHISLGYGNIANNIAIGFNSLMSSLLSGNLNTAIGYNSLPSNSSGYSNLAIGPYTLYGNTGGFFNVAIGQQSLSSNIDGYYNLGIGPYSLLSNTHGLGNFSVGFASLQNCIDGYYNLGLGGYTLYSLVHGNYNVGIGYGSLDNLVDTNYNVGVGYMTGYNAGVVLSSLTNCTFIGYFANSSTNSISNSMALGANSQVSKSNQIVIGDTNITETLLHGKTGIGITPTAALHLPASTAAADTASLKIAPGVLATVAVSGNIESDGTHLYWTDSGGTRHQLDN